MNNTEEIEKQNLAIKPSRETVDLTVGNLVQLDNSVYRLSQILDFELVIGVNVETGRSTPLKISQLQSVVDPSADEIAYQDLDEITDDDWGVAKQRFAAIQPLINVNNVGRALVAERAIEAKVAISTIYRWLDRYKSLGVLTALIPKKKGWREGKSRIDKNKLFVINEVIKDFYLTPQRPTAQKAVTEVERRCMLAGISAPHSNTIRSYISSISEKESLRGRGHKEKAKNKFLPVPGSFPNADFPLSVIQIDHTPADIILVDDTYRKPIGRPWITLAIDVYSRMVTGYYLSFDPPSGTSVAMCIAHSVIEKDEWLIYHGVDTKWPVWGKPTKIHVDNGADFKSNNLKMACENQSINLEFRPVKQPRYGGHIERLLGTLLKEIHDLPGTTFSNIKERDSYNSEKEAVMTKSEFEKWLVTLICKCYHCKMHSKIGMTPIRKWEIGIFGNNDVQGRGIPAKQNDRNTFLLDFMPSFNRTIQNFGVTIDALNYYDEALRPWINASDLNNNKKKQEFIFRRDPRDISFIWFFDPRIKQYFKIHFADLTLPSISIWEYQKARDILKAEGVKSVNQTNLLRAITEMRAIVEESKGRTKSVRKQSQKRIEHEKKITPVAPLALKEESVSPVLVDTELLTGDIVIFGDIA